MGQEAGQHRRTLRAAYYIPPPSPIMAPMSDVIAIRPTGPLRATIRPPGSKSITNRALVCAALAKGDSLLTGALDSEDTRVMIEALRMLGIAVEHDATGATISVGGCGGKVPVGETELFVANSGTTIRFLTAMLTVGQGVYRLDGTPRMRRRPIGDLLAALRSLGGEVVVEQADGFPPVMVRAHGLTGGRAAVAGDISSQFLSGLLMAAPYATADVELLVQGELVSRPYVDMTLAVMQAFGVSVEEQAAGRFIIRRATALLRAHLCHRAGCLGGKLFFRGSGDHPRGSYGRGPFA